MGKRVNFTIERLTTLTHKPPQISIFPSVPSFPVLPAPSHGPLPRTELFKRIKLKDEEEDKFERGKKEEEKKQKAKKQTNR